MQIFFSLAAQFTKGHCSKFWSASPHLMPLDARLTFKKRECQRPETDHHEHTTKTWFEADFEGTIGNLG